MSSGALFADQPSLFLTPDAPLRTMGDLAVWLDAKPTPALFAYLFYGRGEVERIACFNALVRRELRHQLSHHQGSPDRLSGLTLVDAPPGSGGD